MLKSKVKLPNKLSDLMVLALKDLAKCERNKKKFKIEMGTWYHANGHCEVCFAGAVMAQSCGVPKEKARGWLGLDPSMFARSTESRLRALDHVRAGFVGCALDHLGLDWGEQVPRQIEVTDYDFDPKQWRKDMGGIVKLLRKHGL